MQVYSYYRNRYEEIRRPPHGRARLAVAAPIAVLSAGLIWDSSRLQGARWAPHPRQSAESRPELSRLSPNWVSPCRQGRRLLNWRRCASCVAQALDRHNAAPPTPAASGGLPPRAGAGGGLVYGRHKRGDGRLGLGGRGVALLARK
jgi:hypothetical protein